jgi:hypothetical protein
MFCAGCNCQWQPHTQVQSAGVSAESDLCPLVMEDKQWLAVARQQQLTQAWARQHARSSGRPHDTLGQVLHVLRWLQLVATAARQQQQFVAGVSTCEVELCPLVMEDRQWLAVAHQQQLTLA